MVWFLFFRGVFAFILVFLAGNAFSNEIQRKSFNAVYTSQAPKIDGRLDDTCYRACPCDSTFTQRYPDEGKLATEITEFRVLYDRANLYFTIRAYDSKPMEIIGHLVRRDEDSKSDWICIDLDPYLDRRSGFSFVINPAGVKMDGIIFNNTDFDKSWDGVWDGAAKRDSLGWCAEFKIPFSILRFKHKPNLTFGLNIMRGIIRKMEADQWALIPMSEPGWVSRAGNLTGIEDIAKPKYLELLPYEVTRVESKPKDPKTNPKGTDYSGRLGGDLKYGVASNLTLDISVNPDFGQLEADPQVLNLTAYETFYPEKRPLFLEGSALFVTPIQMFYSRRIGKALYEGETRFPVNENTGAVKNFPDFAPILAAGKLTGKAEKVSLGLLEGVTGEAYAILDSSGVERQRLVEPLTNFFVLRSKIDIGSSNVGFLGTAVSRNQSEPGTTGGLDWIWRFAKNAYSFKGQFAGSRAGLTGDRENGFGTVIKLNKEIGKYFLWTLNYEAYSPEFGVNDLGYLSRNNLRFGSLWAQVKKVDRPFGPFQNWYGNLIVKRGLNFHHDELIHEMNVNTSLGTRNWWTFGGGVGHTWQTYDDRATRGGSLVVNPASSHVSTWLNTDSRKPLCVKPNVSLWHSMDGSRGGNTSFYTLLNFASNISLSFSPGYSWSLNRAQWITNVDDNGDEIYDHYVFGELLSKTLDLTTRTDITFTPNLSFQLYGQPFLAVGHYERIKELLYPKSYEFVPYNMSYSPDFNEKSLRGNAVLRWEYGPGSTLFLVWTQNRYNDLNNPGDFSPRRDLSTLLHTQSENVFVVKANYWLNL
jgi:hypothetical protein